MNFFQLCKNVIKFIFQFLPIFITGTILTVLIFMLGLEVINYNEYGKALQIDVPKRHADFRENTHGGFHHDGHTWEMYQLTDEEVANLDEAVNTNDNWKPINDEVYSLLDHHTTKYWDRFTKTYDGWYCLYNDQTRSHALPSELEGEPSYNFIIGLYIKNERQLWIYEDDT